MRVLSPFWVAVAAFMQLHPIYTAIDRVHHEPLLFVAALRDTIGMAAAVGVVLGIHQYYKRNGTITRDDKEGWKDVAPYVIEGCGWVALLMLAVWIIADWTPARSLCVKNVLSTLGVIHLRRQKWDSFCPDGAYRRVFYVLVAVFTRAWWTWTFARLRPTTLDTDDGSLVGWVIWWAFAVSCLASYSMVLQQVRKQSHSPLWWWQNAFGLLVMLIMIRVHAPSAMALFFALTPTRPVASTASVASATSSHTTVPPIQMHRQVPIM